MKTSFDQFAHDYQDILTAQLANSGFDADYFAAQKARIVAEESSPLEGQSYRLLDVGCGNGKLDALLLAEWARRGWIQPDESNCGAELVGIDVSEQSVAECLARRLPASLFQVYDGRALPFPDAQFDAVIFCVVMHHVPVSTRDELLAETRRVLKPGGKIFIFEHNPLNPLTRHIVRRCPFDADAVLLRSGETVRRLTDAGFRVNHVKFINFLPNWTCFRLLMPLEAKLAWLPMGSQYYVQAALISTR